MVEVFKTNVRNNHDATALLSLLAKCFSGCSANFDLDDCDHILRIDFRESEEATEQVIALVRAAGFHIEILPDEILLPAHLADLATQPIRDDK